MASLVCSSAVTCDQQASRKPDRRNPRSLTRRTQLRPSSWREVGKKTSVSDSPPTYRWVFVGVLLLHAMLLWNCIGKKFASVDEAGHLPAGIACWVYGDYSQYRVNPPLARMVASLPVVLARPDTNGIYAAYAPGARPEWASAREFARRNSARYRLLLSLARLAGIGWSILGGCLVYRWSCELYRTSAAGLMATLIWCFGPSVLAHAQMDTPDLPGSVAALAATYVFWCYLHRPTWGWAVFAGSMLGVAQLTKMTLLVLYGVWPLLALLHWIARRDSTFRSVKLRGLAGHLALVVAVSLLVLNAGYEFTGSCRLLGEYRFVSKMFSGDSRSAGTGVRSANRFSDSWLGAVPVPLPAPYLEGMDIQRNDFESPELSYLRGEWRDGGWWYYYLYALAVKVPLGFWVLVLAALLLTLTRHPCSARWEDEATLWFPALAVLALVSSQTGFNAHLRYVLPVVPFVVVATAKLAYFFDVRRLKVCVGVSTLLGWGVVSSLIIHPHYLAYFNELAGGPENGHNHLVNSNIEWGQDVYYLKDWLAKHPEAQPLGLVFYHVLEPAQVVGLKYRLPPAGPHNGWWKDTNADCIGPSAWILRRGR